MNIDQMVKVATAVNPNGSALLAMINQVAGFASAPQSGVWAVAQHIIGGGGNPAMKAIIDRIGGPHIGMSPAIERIIRETTVQEKAQ